MPHWGTFPLLPAFHLNLLFGVLILCPEVLGWLPLIASSTFQTLPPACIWGLICVSRAAGVMSLFRVSSIHSRTCTRYVPKKHFSGGTLGGICNSGALVQFIYNMHGGSACWVAKQPHRNSKIRAEKKSHNYSPPKVAFAEDYLWGWAPAMLVTAVSRVGHMLKYTPIVT